MNCLFLIKPKCTSMKNSKITLRGKPISLNRLSLYLDYYPKVLDLKADKLISKEYLGLYVYQYEVSELHHEHNQKMLAQAEEIKKRRELSIKENEGYLYGVKK